MEYAKPKTIFIVDDDALVTETLRDYLTRKIPHTIRVFKTGEDCLNHLPENPDIIILDYYLNSVNKDAADGLEIMQTIKRYYPNTRIIMLSSQERYSKAMELIQKGAEQYVVKDLEAFEKIASMVNDYWSPAFAFIVTQLSIIIPTKDREVIFRETLHRAYSAIAKLDAEIIVVNDSKTRPIATPWPGLLITCTFL